MRQNITVGKRKFVAIWQVEHHVWDVYTTKTGHISRLFVPNQRSLREAKAAVRARLTR